MVKKERWALPLQVDNMYTRGGVGELRGGGREGVKIEQIEGERERRWGGGREKVGRWGRGSFTGTLVKGRRGSKKALQWKPTRSCLNFSFVCMVFLFVFSLRLKLP